MLNWAEQMFWADVSAVISRPSPNFKMGVTADGLRRAIEHFGPRSTHT